jgi:hypothetical protein
MKLVAMAALALLLGAAWRWTPLAERGDDG